MMHNLSTVLTVDLIDELLKRGEASVILHSLDPASPDPSKASTTRFRGPRRLIHALLLDALATLRDTPSDLLNPDLGDLPNAP